jgi:hypothetical protein
MPLLNLTDNEQLEFDALEPGWYFAEVFEAEDRETKGSDDAKLPKGTPMIWMHFKITGRVGEDAGPTEESEYYNRRAFRSLIIPPETLDGKPYAHFKKMNGMIIRCLMAMGYTEEELTSGDFDLDTDDLIEKQLAIRLNRKPGRDGEMQNNVIGFRSLSEVQAEGVPSGLL